MSVKPTNIPTCHLRKSADSAGNFSRHCKLGEVTENIRTFALPFELKPYTFKMSFEYDSWNRMQRMTYPDGEVVTYGYNIGGMLEQVTGDKGSEHNEYLHHIEYNTFEQKETVYYGNGTVTDYSYDVLLRLGHLRSACADGTMQDIDYTYDEVSNISKIVNYANMLPTGLGGTYGSQFTYDNLYRLTYADGNWQGNNSLYYETSMEYEKNGRISRKVLYADTWLDGNYATESCDNEYYYANSSQPNTLSYINDNPDQFFEWDLKGNMVFHYNGHSDYNRSLCWDEQNRLLGVKDDKQRLSYYLYDANGDRTYKFTGEYAVQNQSGQWHYYYLLNCPTLYASPYLVTNKKGYTKHYYAESERIASRIGGGGLYDLHKGFENYPDMVSIHKESSVKLFYKVMDCLDADALPQEDALKYLYEWQEVVEDEKDCYWYHPDHLGSSSWITYSDGKAVQHLHYLPWGEDFVDQRTSSFSSMYTFSAKEKDIETGYSYFGSRYYNSDLSIWLSVDPMADKYPSLSPYVYCADNPILMIDDDGNEYDNVINELRTVPGKLPTDPKHPQKLEEVVIKAPPTTNAPSTNQTQEKIPLTDHTSNCDVITIPFQLFFALDVFKDCFVEILWPIGISILSGALFQGDTRPQYSNQQSKETSQQIDKIAKEKGMTPVKGKYSHGQKIYKKGNKYYSRDVDKHNGGEWKVFEMKNGKLKRIGTADKDLKIFKE